MPTTTPERPWSPLLVGAGADVARRAALDIADALVTEPTRCRSTHSELTSPRTASLAGGSSGLALLHGYLAAVDADERALDRCADRLGHALETLPSAPMGLDFFGGLPGLGWATDLLSEHLIDLEGADPCTAVDHAVLRVLDRDVWTQAYDLVIGLVGLGVYALRRRDRGHGDVMLRVIIGHLEATSVEADGGIAWFTPADLLPPHRRAVDPRGNFDLGLAHGVPGVIALLARMVAAGVEVERASTLLDGAMDFVLGQKLDEDALSVFPSCTRGGRQPEPSRLAWCYGDAGVAVAMLAAGAAAGRDDWRDEALSVLRHAARRTIEEAGVVDTPICHGAAGLLHAFNCAYQATGDPVLGDAARRWARAVLDLREGHPGLAGFAAYQPRDGEGNEAWVADPGLLGGAAGVALCLLAATTDVAPSWDGCLLTDIPQTLGRVAA